MAAEPRGPRKRIDEQIVELSIKAGEGLLVELKAKGSITELISRLLEETSSEKQTYSRFQESSSVDRESRDRTLQSTVEQIHDDPVPEMVEQLVKHSLFVILFCVILFLCHSLFVIQFFF